LPHKVRALTFLFVSPHVLITRKDSSNRSITNHSTILNKSFKAFNALFLDSELLKDREKPKDNSYKIFFYPVSSIKFISQVNTNAVIRIRFTDPEVLKNVTVHAGTNFLNETGYAYAVEKVIIHANFNILLIRNDIGLLRLKTDIAYNKVVQAIPVANTDSIAAGESCFLTGWGRLKVRNDDPKRSCHLTYEVMRSRDALT